MNSVKMSIVSVCLISISTVIHAQINYEENVVDRQPPKDPWMKLIVDVNNDLQVDLIVAGRGGPVVWYEAPLWEKHVINESVGSPGTTTGVAAADIDQDGDQDVILANGVWFENPGQSLVHGVWQMREYGDKRGHDVYVADLNSDGQFDIITRDQGDNGGQILIHRQARQGKWLTAVIDDVPLGEGLAVGDIDGDGDVDLVIADRWYENTGEIESGQWKARLFTGEAAAEPDVVVKLEDVNRDFRLDVVVAPAERAGQRSKILWYKAPPDPKNEVWQMYVIDDDVECVHHSLQVADMDRDGDFDIVTAQMHQGEDPDEVMVYLNQGQGDMGLPENWLRQVISEQGSHSVQVGDVDGDGDMDIFGANWNTVRAPDGAVVKLWINKNGG